MRRGKKGRVNKTFEYFPFAGGRGSASRGTQRDNYK